MNRESRVILLASSGHFLTHMNMLIFPAIVAPLSRDTGLDIAMVFPLSFTMYMLYGALALPAGYLSDHWSRVGILRVCMLGMGLSSIGAGMAPDTWWFTAALAMIGLFCGLYHPAGLGLIAHEIEAQGAAHGLNGIFGNLGVAAAPFITGAVLLVADWRWVYIMAGAMGIAGVALSYVWPVVEAHAREGDGARGDEMANGRDNRVYFAILLAAMTVGGLTYRANMTALPAYFEERAAALLLWIESLAPDGTPNAVSGGAALLISTIYLFSMAGQYVGGKVADRMDLRRSYLVFIVSAAPFALGMYAGAGAGLYLAAAGFVFFTLGLQPIENSLVSKFTPKKWLSTGYGLKFTLTFGLGSVAVYQVAVVEKWWGLGWLYPALAAQVLLMAGLALVLMVATKKIKLVTTGAKTGESAAP